MTSKSNWLEILKCHVVKLVKVLKFPPLNQTHKLIDKLKFWLISERKTLLTNKCSLNSNWKDYKSFFVVYKYFLCRVCVMDKGNIVEIGCPQELITDKTAHFHKLAKSAGIL